MRIATAIHAAAAAACGGGVRRSRPGWPGVEVWGEKGDPLLYLFFLNCPTG